MLGGIETGWKRKTRRHATPKQVLAGKRNWQQLQIKGCESTLRQIARDCNFSPIASNKLLHAVRALALCVDVHWHKQRKV